eukprot:7672648-Prorocentrum_lima.AAC.1
MLPRANFQCVDLHIPAVSRALRPDAGAGTGTAKILHGRPHPLKHHWAQLPPQLLLCAVHQVLPGA